MKRLFAAALLLFFLEGSNQIISAQTGGVKSLRGLRGVGVLIEDLQPNAKKVGLTESQLKIDVEVELRKAGIPVLTDDKRWDTPGMPKLYVNINSVDRSGLVGASELYAYGIKVALQQMVDLRRNRSMTGTATTWETGTVGSVGKNNFKKVVGEAVRDLIFYGPEIDQVR